MCSCSSPYLRVWRTPTSSSSRVPAGPTLICKVRRACPGRLLPDAGRFPGSLLGVLPIPPSDPGRRRSPLISSWCAATALPAHRKFLPSLVSPSSVVPVLEKEEPSAPAHSLSSTCTTPQHHGPYGHSRSFRSRQVPFIHPSHHSTTTTCLCAKLHSFQIISPTLSRYGQTTRFLGTAFLCWSSIHSFDTSNRLRRYPSRIDPLSKA